MYGVVQGGAFEDLRKESAEFIGRQDFEALRSATLMANPWAPRAGICLASCVGVRLICRKKNRAIFLGIGKIEDVFDAVELGMDTFDCVIPTREARHGSLWTKFGRFDIKKESGQGAL